MASIHLSVCLYIRYATTHLTSTSFSLVLAGPRFSLSFLFLFFFYFPGGGGGRVQGHHHHQQPAAAGETLRGKGWATARPRRSRLGEGLGVCDGPAAAAGYDTQLDNNWAIGTDDKLSIKLHTVCHSHRPHPKARNHSSGQSATCRRVCRHGAGLLTAGAM